MGSRCSSHRVTCSIGRPLALGALPEHQYDIVGDATLGNVYENGEKCSNEAIGSNYDGWIDLFGWGTGSTPTLSVTDVQQYLTYREWGKNTIQNKLLYWLAHPD